MPVCKRITKPWEDLQGRKDWESFDWSERTWFVDTRSGILVMAEIDRDRDTGEITGTRETRPRSDRAVEFLTFAEFETVFDICDRSDCTIMEAVIELKGEENLPKTWVQRALNAPEVRYKYAKKHVAATTVKEEPKVFVSPLAKKATETAAAPQTDADAARKAKKREQNRRAAEKRRLAKAAAQEPVPA